MSETAEILRIIWDVSGNLLENSAGDLEGQKMTIILTLCEHFRNFKLTLRGFKAKFIYENYGKIAQPLVALVYNLF